MKWAFDADVLIYAGRPGHELGERVLQLLDQNRNDCCGSVLLISELLIGPTRLGDQDELDTLAAVLARLELIAVSAQTAHESVQLGARYGLKLPDAIHLATAISAGAETFLTNNSRDFKRDLITEIAITYPIDL